MNRRLNITLPEETVSMLDRTVSRGQRSRLIDEAVRRFINEQGRANLRKQLELGAKARPSVTGRSLKNGSSFLTNPHDSTKEGRHLSGQFRPDYWR